MTDRVPFPGNGDKVFWANIQVGEIIEGTFTGEQSGMYGFEYLVTQGDGAVKTVTSCGATERAMPHLRIGAHVIFQYNGKQRSRKPGGAEFHSVDVAAGDGNDWLKVPRRVTAKGGAA